MKYAGKIGFAEMVETEPGVWEEQIIEKEARGEIIRNTRQYQMTQEVNDNLNISNSFSIISNPYFYDNMVRMKYLWFRKDKWKITNVDASTYPRLTLEVGGLYNDGQ